MTDPDAGPGQGAVIPFPVASLPVGSSAEEVLSSLYARFAEKMVAYAEGYVSRDDAEDIVQQAFVEVWQRYLSTQRETSTPYEAVLLAAVRFRLHDYRRVTKRRQLLITEFLNYFTTLRPPRWMEASASATSDEFNKTIDAALASMTPRTREVQFMYRRAEFSVEEIVIATGLARENVRCLIQRGNRIVRDYLDRAGYSPESRRGDARKGIKS
jgi:RNA polymerase sigma factor (sigma-70 family)